MTRARELAAIGFKPTEAHRVLVEEMGCDVTPRTVARWMDHQQAERDRLSHRARARRRRAEQSSYRWPWPTSPDWRLGRMRALRDAGLSCEAIAKVLNHDFPDTAPLTVHQVRGALDAGRVPNSLRREMRSAEEHAA